MGTEFKVGDTVYHKSNSSIVWVVEEIKNNELYCSTIDLETRKQVKEWINKASVEKINDGGGSGIYFGNSPNTDRW